MHGDTAAPLTPWVPTGWPRSQQHPQLLLSPFLGSEALRCCFCWLLGSTQTADPVLLLLRCSSWITTSLAGVLLPALCILGGTQSIRSQQRAQNRLWLLLSQHPASCQGAFLGDGVSQHLKAQSVLGMNHVCERDGWFFPQKMKHRPPAPLGSVAN